MKLFKQSLWILMLSFVLSLFVGCSGSGGSSSNDDDDDTTADTEPTVNTFNIKDNRILFGSQHTTFGDDGVALSNTTISASDASIVMTFDETGAAGTFTADVSIKLVRTNEGGTFKEITLKMPDVKFSGSAVSISLPSNTPFQVDVTFSDDSQVGASPTQSSAFSASNNQISVNLAQVSAQASTVLQGNDLLEGGSYTFTLTFGSGVTIKPNNVLTGSLTVQ
ncbi:MAG: hypothetical protein HQM14_05605 [SAR324 cluster bacterium]|nr:hypothetical protein [SAR324 cluster bacterium]